MRVQYNGGMSAIARLKLTPEEYLEIDRKAELKCEYHDGELFPLVAVTLQHAAIGANLTASVVPRLRQRGCRAVLALRVRVNLRKFVYPDLAIICGEPALTDEHHDTLTNPVAIVEILSPSTADYDYGGKFALYRTLPSFREYALVSQSEPRVEVFRKADDGTWVLSTIPGLEASFTLSGVDVPLAEIYEGVEFIPTE